MCVWLALYVRRCFNPGARFFTAALSNQALFFAAALSNQTPFFAAARGNQPLVFAAALSNQRFIFAAALDFAFHTTHVASACTAAYGEGAKLLHVCTHLVGRDDCIGLIQRRKGYSVNILNTYKPYRGMNRSGRDWPLTEGRPSARREGECPPRRGRRRTRRRGVPACARYTYQCGSAGGQRGSEWDQHVTSIESACHQRVCDVPVSG